MPRGGRGRNRWERGLRRRGSSFRAEVPGDDFLMVGAEECDDLFGVDDSEEVFFPIDYGEGAQVVLVEELGYLAAVGVDVATDEVAVG